MPSSLWVLYIVLVRTSQIFSQFARTSIPNPRTNWTATKAKVHQWKWRAPVL